MRLASSSARTCSHATCGEHGHERAPIAGSSFRSSITTRKSIGSSMTDPAPFPCGVAVRSASWLPLGVGDQPIPRVFARMIRRFPLEDDDCDRCELPGDNGRTPPSLPAGDRHDPSVAQQLIYLVLSNS
jgi:hypothetical protein